MISFGYCRRLADGLALAGLFACAHIARAQNSAHAISAFSLIPTQAGEFTVALPPGWTATASPGGASLEMRSNGRPQPTIYMLVVGVSDLRYRERIAACTRGYNPFGNALTQCVIPSVRLQLADSRRRWAAPEAFQLILQRLQQAGQRFNAPLLIPGGGAQAFYRVAGTGPAGAIENWGIIGMSYLPNPLLGPQEVTSLALVKGCSAPPKLANDNFRRVCAGVLNSLRPSPGWGGRLAARMADAYVQEANILLRLGQVVANGSAARGRMITGFGQSMQQMQLQTFTTMQKKNYRTGQDWIAAFAGNTLSRDPATGHLFSVPYGYDRYGIDDRGVEPVIIYGNGVKPGTSVGGATVQRMLR